MEVSIFVAMDEAGVIGAQGDIPWRLPEDWKWFRRHTMGKALIMGRRTYESIGRPLPGRTTIVVTRRDDFEAPGCLSASSFEAALQLAASQGIEEAVAAGGTAIYAAALPIASKLYITRVHATVEGDTRFPDTFDPAQWRQTWRRDHEADARHQYPFTSMILERLQDTPSTIDGA